MAKRVVVIGCGDVGTLFAVFLSQMNAQDWLSESISVVTVDHARHGQYGAKAAAILNHATGFEYFKPDHVRTGQLCIQGAITKALLFPPQFFESPRPQHFLVSCESSEKGQVPFPDFVRNAQSMTRYFEAAFQELLRDLGWSYLEARHRLGYTPEEFGHRLEAQQLCYVKGVVGGFSAAGGPVNMALDHALKKSALEAASRQGALEAQLVGTTVQRIERRANTILVATSQGEFEADFVVLSAGHSIPALAGLAGGKSHLGSYYLNGTTYCELPATSDGEVRSAVSRTNFVLQGDDGCMYACVAPPTDTESGLAAIYYPSFRGSQIAMHRYDPGNPKPAPTDWEEAILTGTVPDIEERKANILAQACRFNPFLRNYAVPRTVTIRTVFSPDVAGNPDGKDRRVREMLSPTPIDNSGRLVCMSSPKWTTVELAALTLVQKMLLAIGERPFPTKPSGFGPLQLDVPSIQKQVHLRGITFPREYALQYAIDMHFPRHLIPDVSSSYSPANLG